MRLIDTDALKEKIVKWLKPSKPDEDELISIPDALVSTMMTIDEQPTIYNLDAVIEQLEDIQSSLKKAEKIMDVAYVYSADVDLKILIQKLKAGGMD